MCISAPSRAGNLGSQAARARTTTWGAPPPAKGSTTVELFFRAQKKENQEKTREIITHNQKGGERGDTLSSAETWATDWPKAPTSPGRPQSWPAVCDTGAKHAGRAPAALHRALDRDQSYYVVEPSTSERRSRGMATAACSRQRRGARAPGSDLWSEPHVRFRVGKSRCPHLRSGPSQWRRQARKRRGLGRRLFAATSGQSHIWGAGGWCSSL